MNITNIQSAIAPILAPIAPAVIFGNNLHAGMIGDGVNPTLAIVASVLGTGGVELAGALACSMAVMAYHRRDNKIMVVSVVAAVIYAIFVMVGIAQAKNTATFGGAVVISLVAYLMQGVWQSYNNKLRTEQAETDMQIKAMEAERKLVNAQTRQAKAGGGESYTKLSETYRKTDWRNVPEEDRAHIAKMRTNEIMVFYQVSERTAQNWKHNAQAQTTVI
jgi:hypothetical protein